MTRDIDWGIPVPLPGWEDNPAKRLYVWFDAVIGYLSASIEWARRTGDDEAWKRWWSPEISGGETPIETGTADDKHGARSYYFMGKDNITFHSQIWPAELLAYNGEGARGGKPGVLGELALPTEVVSSEFLTMEGRKFSSSRSVVIYVRDFLERYDADALRYFIAVAGPETTDTDFTWAEFLRRNNDELVAGWGNLVNRTISIAAKNFGAIPAAGPLTAEDEALLDSVRGGFDRVGGLIARHRQKAAINEAMRIVGEANKYLSDQAPWKLKDDPERMGTILHVALQAIKDCNTLLTPFLPHAAQQIHELLGGTGVHAPMPGIKEVDDLDGGPGYPILTGDYTQGARWEHVAIEAGTPLPAPKPVFRKLDPSIVEEELARLGAPQ
jgi:methionyl-tRNA synthetase